jgi:hypothetical protein
MEFLNNPEGAEVMVLVGSIFCMIRVPDPLPKILIVDPYPFSKAPNFKAV